MANATDFIGSVYDELRRQLGMNTANGSTFMLMAWPGYALSPSDFKPADAPHGPYDPDVAREAVSQLANIAPAFSRMRFDNSGFQIDDLYEIILSSAIPVGATPETVGTNPIFGLFSDAGFEFAQAKRGSKNDPNSFYYACNAAPNRWYDETVPSGWTTITLRQSDVKPVASTSEFAKAGGVELAEAEVWRLKPTAAESAGISKTLDLKLAAKATRARPVPSMSAASGALIEADQRKGGLRVGDLQPIAATSKATSSKSSLPKAAAAGAAAGRASNAAGVQAAKHQALFARTAEPQSVGKLVDARAANLAKADLGIANLKHRLLVQELVTRQLPRKPPAGGTDGFDVSFEFCRVNLERSWLKLALLKTKNWWMFDTKAGEYSTGDADTNPGMFPLLSTSLIAIRNLRITANWKGDDQQNLKNAASFAFFDLKGGTVNSNTIEVKGLQIIGWVCTLMPPLPPLSPP